MVLAGAHRSKLRLICALVLGATWAVGTPAYASGQGKSGSGSESGNSSEGSNGSSNNSNDSSKSSNNSSNNSNDSSKSSNESTQNSPKNSTDGSTQWTTDNSTKSQGAQNFWAVSAIVLVGASVVGTVVGTRGTKANQQRTAVALAAFIRQNHGLLTHDMAMAGGPMLDAWAHQLGLSATEKQRLAVALEGSAEQGALIAALDGPIDEARAQRFSAAFFRVATRALGPKRMDNLVVRAAGRMNGG